MWPTKTTCTPLTPEIAVRLIPRKEEKEERVEGAMGLGSSLFLKANDKPRPLEGKVWIPEELRSE